MAPPAAKAPVPAAWYPFITLVVPVAVLIQSCPSCTTGADGKDHSSVAAVSGVVPPPASNVEVFLNGVLLKGGGDDYTASNGSSVVLASGADTSDILTVLAFSEAVGSGDTVIDTFTGDGSTTNFTLSTNPKREENTSIFVNGVYQSKSTYSLSGTTLIFASAPSNSAAIEVEIGTRSVNTEDVTSLLPSRAEIFFTASF